MLVSDVVPLQEGPLGESYSFSSLTLEFQTICVWRMITYIYIYIYIYTLQPVVGTPVFILVDFERPQNPPELIFRGFHSKLC